MANSFLKLFLYVGGVPFWAYIIIAAGVVLLLIAVIVILYGRMDRW